MIIENELKEINQHNDSNDGIMELGGTGGCNGEITNLVHRVKRLKAKNIRVRLRFSCHDCNTSFKTEDYELEIVSAKVFFGLVSCLNDGNGEIYATCPRCGEKNRYGNYRGTM